MKKFIPLLFLFVMLTADFAFAKFTINGKVVDEKNFPVSGVVVSVNNATANTDKNGKFSIADVEPPYRAFVYDASTNITVIYDALSINNPNLILFGRQIGKNANTAYVNILVDSIPNSSRCIIKFISQYTN